MAENKGSEPNNRFQSCVHIAAEKQDVAMGVTLVYELPALRKTFANQYISLCAFCAGSFHMLVFSRDGLGLRLFDDALDARKP